MPPDASPLPVCRKPRPCTTQKQPLPREHSHCNSPQSESSAEDSKNGTFSVTSFITRAEELGMRGIIDAARTKAIDVLHRSGLKLANSPARVVHAESGLPVGEDERLEEYSEITSALVELAQACMIERAKMKWYVLDDRSSKDEAPEVTQEVTTGAPGSGAASSGCRGKFLATSDWRLNKHLLIVIPGTGAVRAGVWGRQLCLVDSLEHGTALSVVSWAANEKGWGVVLMDPNDPALVEEGNEDDDTRPVLYVMDVFRALVAHAAKNAKFSFIAHSFGGACFVDLLHDATVRNVATLSRMSAAAFTDSVHHVEGNCLQGQTGALHQTALAWLAQRSLAYRCDASELDTLMWEMNESMGCKCVSAGTLDHPGSNWVSEPSMREFLSRMVETMGPFTL